jgi:DNA-3-methyladenine glycosylase
MSFDPLPYDFFSQAPLLVARRLLGQRLVRCFDGELLAGRIVEVEAYGGQEDSTSHAFRGARGRAMGMFGQVGHAYVYLIYGMYSCLNVVAHPPGGVGAILIRALAPECGVEQMRSLRKDVPPHLLTSGPGRLCSALAIDRTLDGIDLCDQSSPLYLAAGPAVPDAAVTAGPRIGVRGRPEDLVRPWRLFLTDDPNVSPGRRRHSGFG